MSKLAARVCELIPDARTLRADGNKWATLYGPPGTGKTTSMLRLIERHLETGAAEPDRLMVATFTRNARAEAFGRLRAATGLDPKEFPWVRTIHSSCYRLLELDSVAVMGPKDYARFGEEYGYTFTLTSERDLDDPFGAGSMRTFDDWLLTADELRRNKLVTIEQAVATFRPPLHLNVGYSEELAGKFSADLEAFKTEAGLLDFTDMLTRVVAEGLRPGATHLFVDEAQDLTPLQWQVINLWAEDARRVFVFGDDDQAIFEWSGADPRALMQLPGSQLVLSRSHRLPSAIHAEALALAAQITERVDKRFEPLAEGGHVGRVWSWWEALSGAAGTGGRMLLLARNRAHLEAAREVLRYEGTPFRDRGGGSGIPPVDSARGRALRTALALHDGKPVMGRMEVANLASVAGSRLWPAVARAPLYSLDTLGESGARPHLVEMLRDDPLAAIRMPDRERQYLRDVIRQHGAGALEVRPSLELSTIHGVKGEEADVVVTCTSMTGQTYAEYRSNPDAEHRVFYVAATRSKHALYWLRMSGAAYEW